MTERQPVTGQFQLLSMSILRNLTYTESDRRHLIDTRWVSVLLLSGKQLVPAKISYRELVHRQSQKFRVSKIYCFTVFSYLLYDVHMMF